MLLKLENVGMIKEASVKLDGLTIIAGENDTGKTTFGKILYSLIKSTAIASNMSGSIESNDLYKLHFNGYIKKLFKKQISQNGNINFKYEKINFHFFIENNFCNDFKISKDFNNKELKLCRPIFIDTPFIWNIYNTLKTINNLNTQNSFIEEIDFEVPLITQDLYFCLSTKLKTEIDLNLNINNIIGGEFEERLGEYLFNKNGKEINLANTAMGIKYFGILQVLEKNNHLFKNQILILDEPEVHLHPKWQLKYAEILVELVKNGVIVLVTSHSPYIVEALKVYSDKENLEDKTNFYLAESEDGVSSTIKDVTSDLEPIFEKLSEPFNRLEKEEIDNFKW